MLCQLVKFHSVLQITSRKPTWLKDVEGQQLPVTKCYQTMQTAVRTEPSFVSLFEFERTWRPFCGNGIHWIPTESFVRANPVDMFDSRRSPQVRPRLPFGRVPMSVHAVVATRIIPNSRNECCINTEENTRLDEEKTK